MEDLAQATKTISLISDGQLIEMGKRLNVLQNLIVEELKKRNLSNGN
jgi:hypothetical protein